MGLLCYNFCGSEKPQAAQRGAGAKQGVLNNELRQMEGMKKNMTGQLEKMQTDMMGGLDNEMDKMRAKLNDMGNLGGLKDEMAAMK